MTRDLMTRDLDVCFARRTLCLRAVGTLSFTFRRSCEQVAVSVRVSPHFFSKRNRDKYEISNFTIVRTHLSAQLLTIRKYSKYNHVSRNRYFIQFIYLGSKRDRIYDCFAIVRDDNYF